MRKKTSSGYQERRGVALMGSIGAWSGGEDSDKWNLGLVE
jgi:hypothetical protein